MASNVGTSSDRRYIGRQIDRDWLLNVNHRFIAHARRMEHLRGNDGDVSDTCAERARRCRERAPAGKHGNNLHLIVKMACLQLLARRGALSHLSVRDAGLVYRSSGWS